MVTINDLRCEYLVDPLGLDEATPRLSWTITAEDRGWKQRAYQVQVASSVQRLELGDGDLWDSGEMVSAATTQIEYGGKALPSRQECYWRVRVWDAFARKPSRWSSMAHWEMGLLAEDDWQGAAWIGGAAAAGSGDTAAPYLRREFSVSSFLRTARLYDCGLGFADVHLNGARLGGAAERDPAYTAFDKRCLYVTHDVTEQIAAGPNVVGAILGTGWYDVHDSATWNFHEASWRGKPRLRLVLCLDYSDGHTEWIITDEQWRTSAGPILRDGIYSGEIYDARREMPGWDRAGFDDTAWQPAPSLPAPAGSLRARRCPPIRVTQTLQPAAITEPKPGVFIADFGQNLSGHVRLRVNAPTGTSITLLYGEKLHADGTLDTANIDHFMAKTEPPQLFQTDTYICKGGDTEEEWEQRFSYSGFQYAEVTGFPGAPTPHNLTARFAHTELPSAGEFTCSDDLLNKIQQATRWAYLSNAQSIPTDCPQREKNGWTADAHLAAETGLMNFQAASFYTKWLDDLADNQRADGRMGLIVPTGGWGMAECHPAWDSAYAIIAWDLYRYGGDKRILDRHFEPIRRYVDYLFSVTVDGVIPFDSLGDWVPWKTVTPSTLISTVYLFRDAQILAQAARIIGKGPEAAHFQFLAEQTRDAFNAKFLDTTNGFYAGGSQTAQAMPLFYGLVPAEQREAVFAALVTDLERQGHLDTGILGAKYVIRVLAEWGRSDIAYRLVTRPEQPSWAWWIAQGATTLWEDWKGEASLNHIMFGDVSNWFFQWVAGIGLDPDSPGFTHVRIQPQLIGGLTWAKANHESPQGTLSSCWKLEAGTYQLDITIPANAAAAVWLPTSDPAQVYESGSPADQSDGVRFLRHENDRAVYEIGSGTYRFTAIYQLPIPGNFW